MADNNAHSFLSPSSAFRFLSCTKSARLSAEFEDTPSEVASIGSHCHSCAEWKLKSALHLPCKPVQALDREMNECAEQYAQFVLDKIAEMGSPTILIEEKLDLTDWLPESWGTADCLLATDDELHVIDLKYGMQWVDATDNEQLKIYALGGLKRFPNVSTVKISIFQPRRQNVQTVTMTKAELISWGKEVLIPKGKLAYEGLGEFNPTAKNCQWCKCNARCKALAMKRLKLKPQNPDLLTDDEIEEVLSQIDEIVSYAQSVKDYALEQALKGKEWKRFKIGYGQSRRKYADETKVAEKLKEKGYTNIYKTSLRTITDLEKEIKDFSSILGELIVKPQGKPTLVPIENEQKTKIKNLFKEI